MKQMNAMLLLLFMMATQLFAQTEGTFSVTVLTGPAGGGYAPRNIVAIWVENEQGNFVKTLMAYAANRRTHLNIWEQSTTAAGSPFNIVDAITGSTRSSHATRTCTWDGTDVNGTLMADGNYRLRMELTDKNSTGNYSTFNFTKSTEGYTLTPSNVPSFSGISITWEPVITGINQENKVNFAIIPNPGNTMVTIDGVDVEWFELYSSEGKLLMEKQHNQLDISHLANGIYHLKVFTTDGRLMQQKLIKN